MSPMSVPECFCICGMLFLADQLQRAVERQEYSEAAHLLEAVQQLSMHFQSFAQIPKVAELGGRVSTLQKSLQINVMREFELLGTGEESTNPLLLERLKACCLVTDALGYKVGSPPLACLYLHQSSCWSTSQLAA